MFACLPDSMPTVIVLGFVFATDVTEMTITTTMHVCTLTKQ